MRFVSREGSLDLAMLTLNRANKRLLVAIRRKKKYSKEEIYIIIDATFTGRSSKNVENAQFFGSGKSRVFGHKLTNFLLVIGKHTIPIGISAHYTKDYFTDNGIDYKTESQRVLNWINQLPYADFLSRRELRRTTFLLDSGYDNKNIQKAIRRIGSHFLVSICKDRCVSSTQVQLYFKRNKRIPWQSIRLSNGNGTNNNRIFFRIRVATDVRLKGVGNVTVVFSKNRKGKKKYLAASNRKLTGRDIVSKYRKRWKVESWHRKMKQNYGYGDCRSNSFDAVFSHIVWTIVAFTLREQHPEHFPKEGTSTHEYTSTVKLIELSGKVTQIGFKASTKIVAMEAKQMLVGSKLA